MSYSRRVSLIGLFIGFAGVVAQHDAALICGFVVMAAAAICKAIEDKDT